MAGSEISDTTSSSLGYGGHHDPDYPLPSIERDITPTSEGSGSSLASPIYTPSSSPGRTIISESSGYESLNGHLQTLRLGSLTPQASTSGSTNSTVQERSGTSPTPSIRVTPTPSSSLISSRGTEDLVEAVGALEIGHSRQPTQSPEPNDLLAHASTATTTRQSLSRPTTPSRRRRSSSGIDRSSHKVEDEEPPQVLFYEREVPAILTTARNITARLAQFLSISDLHQDQNSRIQNAYQTAIRLSTFQPSSVRIVGFVGDSGVGKSSLINSLLDRAEFTRASNSGAACTCVVTEYHFHDRDDYFIEIEYFTMQELRRQFEQLLGAYRQHKFPESPTMSAADREDLGKNAALAQSTFRASFRNKLDDHPEVLDTLPFSDAIDTMMGWVEQVLPSLGTQENSLRESFSDINQCSNRLTVLASETDERDQAYSWPLIRKLKVYLRSHILSRGLILADLPGLRDLNYARQNVTERYVRQCDLVFAIARIGRAKSDAGVKEVFQLARQASLPNIAVVCTQSDAIVPIQTRKDYPRESNRILEIEQDVLDQKGILASLEQEYIDFGDFPPTSMEESQDRFEVQQERDRALKLLSELEFQLSHYIINIRNRDVSSYLQSLYNSDLREGNLKTFCISNTIYWQERDKPTQKALPFLNLSGIIELRRYCIGIVAESHLKETINYMKHEIPTLLNSVQIWIDASLGDANAERKQEILNTVSAIQRELDDFVSPVSRINDISRELVAKFENQVGQYMRDRAQQWSASAGQTSLLWESFHHSSYAAFCRHDGTYKIGVQGDRCWNEEAMSSMKDAMEGVWNAFDGDVKSYLNQQYKSVDEVFRNVLRVIRASANSDRNLQAVLNSLTSALIHHQSLLLYDIENILEDFEEEMFTVQTDSLSPIRTSIVGQIMAETYGKAKVEYGRSSHLRQKKIIGSGFHSRTLFNNHRRLFKAQFLAISNTLQQTIKDIVFKQFALIGDDLATLRNENAVQESVTNPEFRIGLEIEVARAREDLRKAGTAIRDLIGDGSVLEAALMEE
ncbi:uncharacterized protein TRUGW13939_03223 [Talaromyces rugulosus]|uniref:G domain-containing protein n=1 Tax=Talaromyces rugulosus TaxID=121627 RepID=A0A7H8QSN3_TALRU|nr:uncharacterized protein TRUGW13939_03223 [Talaromyces rugulosus]QKX56123.1 hypothetical protein TRUGW13939_03223 [Talaromyces rugulosus]